MSPSLSVTKNSSCFWVTTKTLHDNSSKSTTCTTTSANSTAFNCVCELACGANPNFTNTKKPSASTKTRCHSALKCHSSGTTRCSCVQCRSRCPAQMINQLSWDVGMWFRSIALTGLWIIGPNRSSSVRSAIPSRSSQRWSKWCSEWMIDALLWFIDNYIVVKRLWSAADR